MHRKTLATLIVTLALTLAPWAGAEERTEMPLTASTAPLQAQAPLAEKTSAISGARIEAAMSEHTLPENFESSLSRLGEPEREDASQCHVYQCHVECPSGCFVDCIDTSNPCQETSNSVSCHGQTYTCGNVEDELCLGF